MFTMNLVVKVDTLEDQCIMEDQNLKIEDGDLNLKRSLKKRSHNQKKNKKEKLHNKLITHQKNQNKKRMVRMKKKRLNLAQEDISDVENITIEKVEEKGDTITTIKRERDILNQEN